MCKYSHTQKRFVYIMTHHTFARGLPFYGPVSGLFNCRLAQPQCVAEARLEGQPFVVSSVSLSCTITFIVCASCDRQSYVFYRKK